MFTKKQIQNLGHNFVYSLFTYSALKLGIDYEGDELVSGHCYLYADRLTKLLNGKGRIASFNNCHYFIEYDGNYFDGLGVIKQTKRTIRLWDYEVPPYPYAYAPEEYNKCELYYQGTNKLTDLEAEQTMQAKDKRAVWAVYDIGFESVKNEFLEELYKKDNITDEELEEIIRKYLLKAKEKINSEFYFEKTDNGFNVGKVYEIYMKLRGLVIGSMLKKLEEDKEEVVIEEPEEYHWEKDHDSTNYITDEMPTMVKNALSYKLKHNKKRED